MQPLKPQKIDLHADYPCPCGKGKLEPIALTEAFGCKRCQQIYVLEQGGYVLEQISSTYPPKKAWQWTGLKWVRANSGLKDHYSPLVWSLIVLPLLGFLWILFTTKSISWPWQLVLVGMIGLLVIWLFWATRSNSRH